MAAPSEEQQPAATAAASAVTNTAGNEAQMHEIEHDAAAAAAAPDTAATTTANCSASEKTTDNDATSQPAVIYSDDKDLEKAQTDSKVKEEPEDPNIVFWDGPDDPKNPYNWPTWKKVFNCALISALTFVTPLASSMFAPGVPQLMGDFQSRSSVLGSFCVSVYILGFAAGPMVFAPLSEVYGRLYIYHACNVVFVIFLIACALAPSLNTLIVFRFFSGVFGSSPLTNGGGTIADMIVQEHRGAAMASFAIGPLLGPIIGPVIGGVITSDIGWRWVFWILAIIAGVISITFFIFARETYAPTLLDAKVRRLQKETGNMNLRSKLDSGLSPGEHFRRAIMRPMKLLVLSPICAICNLYVGIVYGYLYLMFTSLTPLFLRVYSFTTVQSGLAFLGLGIGSMAGVVYFSASSDGYMKKKAEEAKTAAEAAGEDTADKSYFRPEYRLAPLRIGAILLPAGFFIYGWTAQYHTHWIAPIIGTAVIGVGNLIVFMSLQLYLVDTFTMYAASALAANAVVRSVLGAVLPLAGGPMYAKLDYGWGNSLLAFIAILLIPVPWLFMRHGEYLRKKFAIKNL